jgi:hypothetical protein
MLLLLVGKKRRRRKDMNFFMFLGNGGKRRENPLGNFLSHEKEPKGGRDKIWPVSQAFFLLLYFTVGMGMH